MIRRMSVLISAICLSSVILYSWIGSSQSPQPSVQLTTNPSIDQIRPFEAEATEPGGSGQYKPPVKLTLQAIDAQGQALKDARIRLQLFTPSKTPWFTTDFPIVEGTKLLDIEGNAPTGQLQVEQSLPIRGKYQLQINVTPIATNAFPPIEQTLTLLVQESRAKYFNLGVLVAVLLAVGLGGGWIIGGRQPIQSGEVVPQRVSLLLSGAIVVAIAALLFVNISAELANSHTHPERQEAIGTPAQLQSQGLEMRFSGDTSATVGQLAQLQVNVLDAKTQQPITDVALTIKTTQIESNWIAFAYKGTPDRTGKLAWQQGFFDGAPHSIEVEAMPQPNAVRQFQPFKVSQDIPVEGIAPPLYVRLISLTYLTGTIGLGLLLGLKLRQRRNRYPSQPF